MKRITLIHRAMILFSRKDINIPMNKWDVKPNEYTVRRIYTMNEKNPSNVPGVKINEGS